MKHLSDIDLLAALMRDDEVAFTTIYKRYQASLFAVCMKYIKNEDTANDVVHPNKDGYLVMEPIALDMISKLKFKK